MSAFHGIDEQRDDHHNDAADAHHHLGVLPPHGVFQLRRVLFEPNALLVEVVSLVDEELYLLSSLQHLLDVVYHDVLDVVHVSLHLIHLVHLRAKRLHLLGEHTRELLVHRVGQRGPSPVPKLHRKALLDVLQEGECRSPGEVLFRHAHVGKPVVHHDVEDVAIACVANPRVRLRHLFKYLPRDERKVACSGRILGEDHSLPHHKCVHNRISFLS
mmetsp:Transcript_47777/g.97665  ORF Transcript_47777/g.97665 Transcript_47777/m.97665 type:complete len:215 (-) Transcript_47777:158-802(-)